MVAMGVSSGASVGAAGAALLSAAEACGDGLSLPPAPPSTGRQAANAHDQGHGSGGKRQSSIHLDTVMRRVLRTRSSTG